MDRVLSASLSARVRERPSAWVQPTVGSAGLARAADGRAAYGTAPVYLIGDGPLRLHGRPRVEGARYVFQVEDAQGRRSSQLDGAFLRAADGPRSAPIADGRVEVDAALALQAVEEAQQALDDLTNTELRQAEALQSIAEAEQALSDAERVYNSVRTTASQSNIDAAYAELVLAENDLKDAQQKFNDYADKPDTNLTKANLQLKLNSAQAAYDSALSYYNALTSTGSDLDRAASDCPLPHCAD